MNYQAAGGCLHWWRGKHENGWELFQQMAANVTGNTTAGSLHLGNDSTASNTSSVNDAQQPQVAQPTLTREQRLLIDSEDDD